MVTDVVIVDVSVLAAPWASAVEWIAEMRELKAQRVSLVVLAPGDARLPRRRADGESFAHFIGVVGWRAWMRVLAVIRAERGDSVLDERLRHVGAWLEDNVLSGGSPVRVTVISVEAPDELLELVSWAADQRAAGRRVGVRHLPWTLGRPVIGLATDAQRHLHLAGLDA